MRLLGMGEPAELDEADHGLRRVSLEVFATNTPAIRLYESMGFAVDGAKREGVRVGETYVDLLLMSRGV